MLPSDGGQLLQTHLSSVGFAGFWGAMVATTTLQGLVPQERWDVDALYSTEAEPGMSYARFGAFLQVGVHPTYSSLKYSIICCLGFWLSFISICSSM